MPTQFSDVRIRLLLALVCLILLAVQPLTANAQQSSQPGPSLDRAVEALRNGEYQQGLRLLDEVDGATSDIRTAYYRGYALEKLGRCQAAGAAYRRAATAKDAPKLQRYARQALDGFDTRCKPAVAEPSEPSVEPGDVATRTSGRVGWRVFGWTSTIVGGLVMAAVPLKMIIEDAAFSTSEPYFLERYGCEVGENGFDGSECNHAELKNDPTYHQYRDGMELAERSNNYMLIGGAGLVAAGLGTLITLEVTEPTVDVSVAASGDGARVSAVFRF